MNFEGLRVQITQIDKTAEENCLKRWNSIAKPSGGLGVLEHQIVRLAALLGSENIDISKRAVVVLCSDNGVSKYDTDNATPKTTALLAENMALGLASVCCVAKNVGAEVFPVDIGMKEHPHISGLLDFSVGEGTEDITISAAMTEQQCKNAIEAGIELIKNLKASGYNLIATGEMGMGNSVSAAALSCALTGVSAEEAAGRNFNLSAERLARRCECVEKAVSRCKGETDTFKILCQLGGFDTAAMVGMYIGGAIYNCAVLIDGFISAAAALIAVRLLPECKKAMFATHLCCEPAAMLLLNKLDFFPMINAGVCIGDGTGAVAAIPLFDMALSVYKKMPTFKQIGLSAY